MTLAAIILGRKEDANNCQSPTVDMVTLYCTVLYCTVLCMLFCTILYCNVLYCTVLYCTVLTDGGHGDHEEVDTVPVGEALAVLEVGRVTRVLQLQYCCQFW